jgi:PPOX class probable F420-dependent enzyme
MARLSSAEVDALLAGRHTLVIATMRADGTVHLSTVWYRWDGECFWIATNRDRAKYRNIERDPRVSVLVDDPERETSVAASGRAEVAASDAAAYEGALAIVARYVDDPVAYLAERAGEPRVLLRIRPEKMTSWTLR